MHHEHRSAHAGPAGSQRPLRLALTLTASVMVLEVVGGWWTGSVALLADAGHMLTDAAALAMAFAAARLASRRADARRSYGYRRIQVLAAMVNSLTLLALVAWLVVEAVERLLAPRNVEAWTMLWIALLGAALNVGVALLLRRDHEGDINVRAAYAQCCPTWRARLRRRSRQSSYSRPVGLGPTRCGRCWSRR